MARFDVRCVDVEHFLESLRIRNISKATETEMRFSCPYPNHANGDESPSCYMNIETTKWMCHGCKERGDAVTFAAYVLGISRLKAISLLRDAYQPESRDPDAIDIVAELQSIFSERHEEEQRQPILSESLIDRYSMDWESAWDAYKQGNGFPPADYMFERGFDYQTLSEWEFGWDDFSKRIVFSIRDEKGRLIGFKGRATDGRQPKYLVLGDGPSRFRYGFPRYFPSRVVFGAHRIKGDPSLVICEGELNAIAVRAKTGIPAVAINGSYFTEWHAKVIREIASEVVLFLDADRAGREAVWGRENSQGRHHPGIVEILSPFLPVRIVEPQENDAAEMTAEQIVECVERARPYLLTFLSDLC